MNWNDLSFYDRKSMWIQPPAEFTFDPSIGMHWPTFYYWSTDGHERDLLSRINMLVMWAVTKMLNRPSPERLFISISKPLRHDPVHLLGFAYYVRVQAGSISGRDLYHHRDHAVFYLSAKQVMEILRS